MGMGLPARNRRLGPLLHDLVDDVLNLCQTVKTEMGLASREFPWGRLKQKKQSVEFKPMQQQNYTKSIKIQDSTDATNEKLRSNIKCCMSHCNSRPERHSGTTKNAIRYSSSRPDATTTHVAWEVSIKHGDVTNQNCNTNNQTMGTLPAKMGAAIIHFTGC